LISELNVHYDKINNYIESEILGEAINIEVISSLAKLNEINRLAPRLINNDPYSGDFRLGIDVLESILAILQTGAGHQSTKKNLLNLAWDLLYKLYNFSYDNLIYSALLYQWLNKYDLIRSHSLRTWYGHSKNKDQISFNPTDEDLDDFHNKNKQKIYRYMVFDMHDQKEEQDPFSNQQAKDFYHYYETLSNLKL
jgi:hypothetical protein